DNAINTKKIENGAVTNSKIEDSSITQNKLSLNAVNVDNIDFHQHINGPLAPVASSIMFDGTKVYWGNPSPGGGAGGDLGGLYPSPHVVGLRGIPIADFPTLEDNQVYIFRNYGTPTNDDDRWIAQKIKPENLYTYTDTALGIGENGYVLSWDWNDGINPRMRWINFNSQLLNTALPIIGNGEPANPITLNRSGVSPYELYYLSPTTGSWTNGKLMPENFIATPSSPGVFEDGYVLSWNNSNTMMEWVEPAVNTSLPLIGDGTPGNEISINTAGVNANDLLVFDGTNWTYNKIQTPMIADLAVTTSKIADKNVTVGKINNGANDNILVTIAGNSQWQNLNLSSTFTGNGVSIPLGIAAGAIGATEISDAAITSAKLGLLSVATSNIQDNAVTITKINPGIANSVLLTNSAGTSATWSQISASNMSAGDYTSVITSGSYTIDISGNAGTVTNGVYTTGSYADPSWITSLSGSKITGAMTGTTIGFDDVTSATNLGQALLIGNGSTLGPTGTGTITANAITAGTYGISITGNAATSTSLAGNLAGDLPYQSAPGTTAFLNIGANNTILKANGTIP
ncbi:MAG: hypothetical protein HZB41_09075, partial [Ignavibacteriae bacterium]|nr:hypothetical protein [Ignavibacteriota bacterium]